MASPAPPTARHVIAALTQGLEPVADLSGLFLAGSYGADQADAFSDIDMIALAPPQAFDTVAAAWRTALGTQAPIVFWNERRFQSRLLNAITQDWLRCDLILSAPQDFGRRAKDRVKPLIDRAGHYAALPDHLPPATPSPEKVSAIIHEFIRVLGLLPVGLGREEHVLLVKGVGLLRDLLTDLMLEDCRLSDRGGALHLSRLLSAQDMTVLKRLPWPGPEPAALIAAHLAMARVFFPRAKERAASLGVDWPHAFEAATRARLRDQIGDEP